MTNLKRCCFLGALFSAQIGSINAEVIPGTTLSVHFESSQIVGSGRHLNMNRLPVIDIDSGATVYYDVSFKFTLDPVEGLIFDQISSVAVSPPISAANIVPGVYKSQQGYCYKLEGPTSLTDDRVLYTLRGYTDNNECSRSVDPFSVQIVSGSANDHPDIGNREIVSNLKSSYVYGYVSDQGGWRGSFAISTTWEQNELIGIRQSGDQLIIGLFSQGVDNSGTPVDFIDPRETAILTKIIE